MRSYTNNFLQIFLSLFLLFITLGTSTFGQDKRSLHGKVVTTDGAPADYATVQLKGTGYGCTTDEKGLFNLQVPEGRYTLMVSSVGYETVEREVDTAKGGHIHIKIKPVVTSLDEVVVVSTGVNRVKRSAFNAVAVDAKELQNTTKNLSEALAKAPGMKLRESGGVGRTCS